MLPFRYGARNLLAKPIASSATVLGLGLVTFVFAGVTMLTHGIEQSLAQSGRPDALVVLRPGADTELVSAVDRETARILGTLDGVRVGAGGVPSVAAEVVVLVALPTQEGRLFNATARGIHPQSFEVRPDVWLQSGRAPLPGRPEVALGQALVGRSPGAELGGALSFAGQSWRVVGLLASRGVAFESELWTDADLLGQVFERFAPSSVALRLESQEALERFYADLRLHPELDLKVVREDLYWETQGQGTADFLRLLGYFVASVFSLGALLAAAITMYAEVAARRGELAVLRALGFPRRDVLGAVLLEALLLGGAGGLLGAAGASLLAFAHVRTLNVPTFSELRFGFRPTLEGLLTSTLASASAGLLGGLAPALRAARRPILEGLD